MFKKLNNIISDLKYVYTYYRVENKGISIVQAISELTTSYAAILMQYNELKRRLERENNVMVGSLNN